MLLGESLELRGSLLELPPISLYRADLSNKHSAEELLISYRFFVKLLAKTKSQ